jgi:hypothetical protein
MRRRPPGKTKASVTAQALIPGRTQGAVLPEYDRQTAGRVPSEARRKGHFYLAVKNGRYRIDFSDTLPLYYSPRIRPLYIAINFLVSG